LKGGGKLAQQVLKVYMNDTLIQNMEETCQELGIQMAFTLFAEKVIKDKRIPFNIDNETECRMNKKREQTLLLRSRVLKAEEERLGGAQGYTVDETMERLRKYW